MRGTFPVPGVGQFVSQAEALLGDLDPIALVAVAAAVVVLAVAGWFVLSRRSGGSKLRRRLAAVDRVAVLLHPNPDPDAMACGMALAHLAEMVDTEAVIQYPGEIRHQENRAFRTVLDLDLSRITAAADLAADDVVLVDHNQARGFDGAGSVEPLAVVDHHPGGGSGRRFTDVRSEYGACASIFAEYFDDMGATPVPPGEQSDDGLTLPAPVATGLLYGVLSDTKHLTKGCSSAEFEASEYLYPTVDEDALDRIANPEVDAEVLDVKAHAIIERDVRSPFAVSDVGTVSNVDAIPQAADELLCLEGVTAVVVLGDCDGSLHLSGRSRDDRVHMGRALETAVEEIPMSSAGGHARMGGGRVSIDHMRGIGPSNGVSREAFHERLFTALGGAE